MTLLTLTRASLHRRPARTYLSLLTILVAFLLFGFLRSIAVWFDGGAATVAGASRLAITSKYSMTEPLPISQRRDIEGVAGVEAVTHQSWFGGNFHQDARDSLPKFPVEPREYFAMYPEMQIDPAQLEAFANTRAGAVAPAAWLERFEWKIGDKIPIDADIWPRRDGGRLWEFDLVGSFTVADEGDGQFLFHYDYFDEARAFGEGTVGWWTARIDDPDRAPEIAGAIDALFENSRSPTKTLTENEWGRSFAAQLGDLGLMANGILGAVFFTILLLTAVVMNQSLRERLAEFAVLKTLGFSNGRVAAMVLGESMLLTSAGALLGLGLCVVGSGVLNAAMQQIPFFGGFVLSWPTVGAGLAIGVALGVLVGIPPAWAASRLTIAEAQRRT